MKDNKGFVELEGQLTTLGKLRVLENKFDISKFAISDDGVNYRLINEKLIDPYMAIERTVLFNKNNDSNNQLKSRIQLEKPKVRSSAIYDYDINIKTIGENRKVNPIGFYNSNIAFPYFQRNVDGTDRLQYYITNSDIANESFSIEIEIEEENIPFVRQGLPSPISFTLHDCEYFDLRLKEQEKVGTQTELQPTDINWESSFEDSENDEYSVPFGYPKVVTMMNGRGRPNTLNLVYRGNFKYEGKTRSDFNSYAEFIDNTKIYNTTLTIRCELTGKYQDISLQLIKTEAKTEN